MADSNAVPVDNSNAVKVVNSTAVGLGFSMASHHLSILTTTMETPDLSSYIETVYRCKVCQFLGDTTEAVTQHLRSVHFSSQSMLGSLDHSYAGVPQGVTSTQEKNKLSGSLEEDFDNNMEPFDDDDNNEDDFPPGVAASDDERSTDVAESSSGFQKKNYRCSKAGCRLKFPSQEQKDLHEQCHVQEAEGAAASFRCPTCQVKEDTWQDMLVHLGSHTCLFHLYCVICNRSFPEKEHLDRHLAAEHGVNQPDWPLHYKQVHTWRFHLLKEKFSCLRKDCKSYFFNQEELDVHKKCHVENKPYFKCYICVQWCPTWPGMKAHVVQCHGTAFKVDQGEKVDSGTKGPELVQRGFTNYNGNLENGQSRNDQGSSSSLSWFRCKHEGCKVKYRTKEQLKLHNQCHQTGTDSSLFQCPFCETKTTDWEAMRNHLGEHTDLLYLTCEACHHKFPSMDQLDQHFNKQHYTMKSTWTLQKKQRMARRSLERRKKKHKCENPYCKKILFFKEEDLQIHEQCHIENSPDFRCYVPKCARSEDIFKTWIKLKSHLSSVHKVHIAGKDAPAKPQKSVKKKKDSRPTMCEVCGKVYKGRRNLRIHMRRHKEPLRCPQCPKFSTRCRHTLRAHMEKHQGEGKFRCKECGYFAPLKNHLTRHIASVHNESKPYMCDHCGKCFKALGNLNHHVQVIHTDDRPFACKKCDFASKSKEGLGRHDRRMHSDEKMSCPHCNFSTCTASVLEKHLDLHSEDRQHKCPHCTYGFKESNALKRHIEEIHSENHLHHCRVCNYSCNNHVRLEEHEMSHLDTCRYSCDICPFKTKWRASLFRHYKIVHDIKKPVVKLAKVTPASDSNIKPSSVPGQMILTSQNANEATVTVPVTSAGEVDGATAILMGLSGYGAGSSSNMEEYVVKNVNWS